MMFKNYCTNKHENNHYYENNKIDIHNELLCRICHENINKTTL